MSTDEHERLLKRTDLRPENFFELHRQEGCNVQTLTAKKELPDIVYRYLCTKHHVVSQLFVMSGEGNLPYIRKKNLLK